MTERTVKGFMCLVNWDHELGEASGGTIIYSDEEDLRVHHRCIESCGIAEVEVRLVRIVQKGKY